MALTLVWSEASGATPKLTPADWGQGLARAPVGQAELLADHDVAAAVA